MNSTAFAVLAIAIIIGSIAVCGYILLSGTDDSTNVISGIDENDPLLSVAGMDASYVYTGSAIQPVPVISYDGTELIEGTDYCVAYRRNMDAGEASAVIIFTGGYEGAAALGFKILPAALTVVAGPVQTKIFGQSDPVLTYTSYGWVGNDNDRILSGELSRNVGERPGLYKITQGVLSAGPNYEIKFVSDGFEIVALEGIDENDPLLSVSGLKASYGYNGTGIEPVPAVAYSGVLLSGGTDYNVRYFDNRDTGTASLALIFTGSYGGGACYEFSVTPAVLTLTVDPVQTKIFGQSDLVFTYTTYGWLGNDNEKNLSGKLSRAEGESAGLYAILQGTVNAGPNYDIVFESAHFKINVLDVCEKDPLLFVYGLDASYTYAGEDIGPVPAVRYDGRPLDHTDRIVTYSDNKDAGTASLTLTFKGNYAGSATIGFEITPAALTVTADKGQAKMFGENDPLLSYTSSGWVGTDTKALLGGTLGRASGENAGSYNITQGTVNAGPNYEIMIKNSDPFKINALGVNKNDPSLSVSNLKTSYTYNGADIKPAPAVAYRSTSLFAGTDYNVTYAANRNAGTASLTLTFKGNYAGSATIGFEITPAALAVTADKGQAKMFGENDPVLSHTSSGWVGTDTKSLLGGTLGRASGENVGSYNITQGSLSASNYKIEFESAKFDIIAQIDHSVLRYSGAAPAKDLDIRYSYANTDYTVYYVYLGSVNDVPVWYGTQYNHTGSNYSLTYTKTKATTNQIFDSSQLCISQTVASTTASSTKVDVKWGTDAPANFTFAGVRTAIEYGFAQDWGSGLSGSVSKTNTYTTASKWMDLSNSRSFDLSKADKKGNYRWTLFSKCDVFAAVVIDKTGNTDKVYHDYMTFARENDYVMKMDYSEDGSFKGKDAAKLKMSNNVPGSLPAVSLPKNVMLLDYRGKTTNSDPITVPYDIAELMVLSDSSRIITKNIVINARNTDLKIILSNVKLVAPVGTAAIRDASDSAPQHTINFVLRGVNSVTGGDGAKLSDPSPARTPGNAGYAGIDVSKYYSIAMSGPGNLTVTGGNGSDGFRADDGKDAFVESRKGGEGGAGGSGIICKNISFEKTSGKITVTGGKGGNGGRGGNSTAVPIADSAAKRTGGEGGWGGRGGWAIEAESKPKQATSVSEPLSLIGGKGGNGGTGGDGKGSGTTGADGKVGTAAEDGHWYNGTVEVRLS
ncbi:MAG: hypothetical protein LBE48_00270 [Methanomassiliicoccaceae archaeon]|jgi:hypothetical protein|nr:hypothetical protein [Methanomassiliicoccaceae archaeon]